MPELVLLLVPIVALAFTALSAWSFVVARRPKRLVAEGRWAEAQGAAERLERSWMRLSRGVRTGAIYTRALCLHLGGELDASLALLATIEAPEKKDAGLFHAASLLEAAGLVMVGRDVGRAARMLESIGSPASPPEDTLLLAIAKHQLGDRAAADALFDRAGASRPPNAPWPRINEPVFHYLRGLYLLKTKGGAEAAADLDRAASAPVVSVYVQRARALVPPRPDPDLDPRSSLAPQIIDE
ncbi:MAG: hypothetical protein KF819_27350 [Labilithrix sp.]|nr:hypothetical protein [Labilithrix sp.]